MFMVHKYALNFDPVQEVRLPAVFRPLSVQLQDGVPTLWALVDDASPMEGRLRIQLLHTGDTRRAVSPDWQFLATLQLRQGPDAWVAHAFAERPPVDGRLH